MDREYKAPVMPLSWWVEHVVDELADFYEPQEARRWLVARQKLLNGKTPAELIQEGRPEEVWRVIAQLRDGAFV